jgi:hypothetical protein
MAKLVFCGLMLSCPAVLVAQEDPLPDLQKRVDTFFLAFSTPGADPKTAFGDLLAGGPLEKSEDVKKLVDEVRKFDERFGLFVEAEQISARRVGKDLVLLKYLYKGQKFPVVWHFVYYRVPNKLGPSRPWSIISVRFDTRLEMLGM